MRESIDRVVRIPNLSKAAFLLVLEYLYLDGFTVRMDDLVEVWELADMYQLEGLMYACMAALERGVCEENVTQILEEAEALDCSCDELKRICYDFMGRISLRIQKRGKGISYVESLHLLQWLGRFLPNDDEC